MTTSTVGNSGVLDKHAQKRVHNGTKLHANQMMRIKPAFGQYKRQAGAKQQHSYHTLRAALCGVHARELLDSVSLSTIGVQSAQFAGTPASDAQHKAHCPTGHICDHPSSHPSNTSVYFYVDKMFAKRVCTN
jgi:hypothetical protein